MDTGAETLVIEADLARLEDIQGLVNQTLDRFGRIDILINNAGFGRLDWLEELDPIEDIEAQFDVNVLGVVQTTRQALPAMIKQRAGHIINMGSMAALVAAPTYTIYAASKHAVHGFSEALRREVKPWGIHVSMIYPGGVKTEFGEHARIHRKTKATTPRFLALSADDVARAVVGLVRRPRAMLILPWLWSVTVLLNKLFPSFVDYTVIHKFTIPERAEELKLK
jgi:short-subunit dehydrogenase